MSTTGLVGVLHVEAEVFILRKKLDCLQPEGCGERKVWEYEGRRVFARGDLNLLRVKGGGYRLELVKEIPLWVEYPPIVVRSLPQSAKKFFAADPVKKAKEILRSVFEWKGWDTYRGLEWCSMHHEECETDVPFRLRSLSDLVGDGLQISFREPTEVEAAEYETCLMEVARHLAEKEARRHTPIEPREAQMTLGEFLLEEMKRVAVE